MERLLEPEWLDELPANDPQAVGSRRDLARVNRLMGHPRFLAAALGRWHRQQPLRSVADLGAGDGTLLLSVAQRLKRSGIRAHAILVDRQPVITRRTLEEFQSTGWTAEVVTADIIDWLERGETALADAAIANLFLHHFDNGQLVRILSAVSKRFSMLVASEPRRSRFSLTLARSLGFIGCNATTRHDAPASVRAGFCGHELSSLWSRDTAWRLEERKAGLFTHLFIARRIG